MKNFLTLALGLFLISCKNESASRGIIKPDQMRAILWDIIKGDALADEIVKRDSTKNIKNESLAINEKVFSVHHITRDNFNRSVIFYTKHPELLKTIFDSLYSVQSSKDSIQKRHGRKPAIPHIIQAR
jgi:hypothetical protein